MTGDRHELVWRVPTTRPWLSGTVPPGTRQRLILAPLGAPLGAPLREVRFEVTCPGGGEFSVRGTLRLVDSFVATRDHFEFRLDLDTDAEIGELLALFGAATITREPTTGSET